VDGVAIRAFSTKDQPAVTALILGGLAEHWGEVDESLNPDVHDLASAYANGRTVVAEGGNRLVGTGTVFPVGNRRAEIRRMSVAPDCRQLGVGRALVAALVDAARDWDIDQVVLETSAHWDGVVAFYLRCGFVLTHHDDGEFGLDARFALTL
jgi:GNAT superfamily N-acetyltransferase